MTAQHPQGPGSQSSGLQSYPANVVPSGSQGQPFRGHMGQGDGDHGRATPPDKVPADMSEEELHALIHQLTKDQKELSKWSCRGDLKLSNEWDRRGQISKGQEILL